LAARFREGRHRTGHRLLLVVGDHQSISSFRGSSVV
jgi:hypothetical protein